MTGPHRAGDREGGVWPRRTARLVLRRCTPEDAEGLNAIRRLPAVAEWLPRRPTSIEDFRAYLAEPDRLERTLVIEEGGRIVGDLYLHITDGWAQHEVAAQAHQAQAEIGWVLAPDRQGRGLAREAVAELVRVCVTELGIRRVTATCFADNVASWRLMEALGMRRESHTVADALHRTRGWLDGYTYALLAPEDRALRER